MSSLGKNIKHFRKKNGMSQKELAKESGLTQATISRVEREQVVNISKETLKKLAKALQISANSLLLEEEEGELKKALDARAKALLENYFALPFAKKKQLYEFSLFLQQQDKLS